MVYRAVLSLWWIVKEDQFYHCFKIVLMELFRSMKLI